MESFRTSFKSLSDLMQILPTDESCRIVLESLRWSGSPVCPHCGVQHENHYKLKTKGEFKGLYKCKDCRQRFTVTVGTMFEGSHIGLRKWFLAIYIFSNHKKGVSSHQLAKDLGITQKSAWYMLSLIRMSFAPTEKPQMEGVVLADETFIGGKNKNRHADKKIDNAQGRSTKDKSAVFGIMNDGKVDTQILKDTKAVTLRPIIREMVKSGSILVTDEHGGYSGMPEFTHQIVNHKQGEYKTNGFSTNQLEGFWSLLKRGIYGIYHHASPKHLSKYCDEFAYRYNTKSFNDPERFIYSVFNSRERVSYKELILKPVI